MKFNKTYIFSTVKKQFVLIIVILSMTNFVCAGDVESGVWYDSKTTLTWMRCSIGQKWTGSSCVGEAIKLNWYDAMEYPSLFNENGYSGKRNWRLPTISELFTLRNCSKGWTHQIKTIGNLTKDMGVWMCSIPKGNRTIQIPCICTYDSSIPTLDNDVFPNVPDGPYWSSSSAPYAHLNHRAWIFGFKHGHADYNDNENDNYVRLVRTGQ